MSAARTLTLADVVMPRAGLLRNVFLIAAASVVTALAARIAIPVPWSPVPLTGQTFAVLLSGAVLGARRAFIAQALYLIEGAMGLPVFAAGPPAPAIIAGPSGGYLMRLPVRGRSRRARRARLGPARVTMLAAMLLGSVVIFTLGLIQLRARGRALGAGLLPFLPGDLVKARSPPRSLFAWRIAHGADRRVTVKTIAASAPESWGAGSPRRGSGGFRTILQDTDAGALRR
jgi:biotin transport system substrate-specific component